MTQQTFTTPSGEEVLAVEVPKVSHSFTIKAGRLMYNDDVSAWWPHVDLPSDNWQIIGVLQDLTEEQAAELVPYDIEVEYQEYGSPFEIHYYFGGHDYAKDALPEYLRSLGLDPENNKILLLKRLKG
ncbi:MAG TPA: hypothetical protein VD794_02190 [Flavisolibacter sp.]|nr:hypothetical protein [Flavisolibacter sp.]